MGYPERPYRGDDGPGPVSNGGGPGRSEHANTDIIDVIDGRLNKPMCVGKSGVRIGCSFVSYEAITHILGRILQERA